MGRTLILATIGGFLLAPLAIDVPMDVPQFRNLHEKVGFDLMASTSRAGFGFMHDGSVDTLVRFLSEPFFNFGALIDGTPASKVAGMVAFLLSFSGSDLRVQGGIPVAVRGPSSRDTHAAVGVQLTVEAGNAEAPATVAWLQEMMALADDRTAWLPPLLKSFARSAMPVPSAR